MVNLVSLKNVYVLREMMVQRRRKSFQWMLSSGEKIDHLALGMGPGIGAASAPDPGLLASKPGYRFFQLPLDCRMTCLKLESGVVRPLVFNQKGGPPKQPARSVV